MMIGVGAVRYLYRVLKKTNGEKGLPLPNMDKFYLTDDNGKELSFWNDVPFELKADIVTACIEIPKQKCNKFQVIKDQKHHPIMQDTKKNVFTKALELRYYAQFPLFNYGFIPQTWEQNLIKDQLGLLGDDDPIDICQLGKTKKETGSIFKAKVLGCFCLIDQGEVDWKILMVDAGEAEREGINDLSYYPKEQIQAIMQWFKTIKVFDGKKANVIAYNEKIFTKDQTLKIIYETHLEWKKLVNSPDTVYNEARTKFHLEEYKMRA